MRLFTEAQCEAWSPLRCVEEKDFPLEDLPSETAFLLESESLMIAERCLFDEGHQGPHSWE